MSIPRFDYMGLTNMNRVITTLLLTIITFAVTPATTFAARGNPDACQNGNGSGGYDHGRPDPCDDDTTTTKQPPVPIPKPPNTTATASAGYMPFRYTGGNDAAWVAAIEVDRRDGVTTITAHVTMPRFRKGRLVKIDRLSSTAHFDGTAMILDTALPAFTTLALQGREDFETVFSTRRTVTVAPQAALASPVTTLLGTDFRDTRWVRYRSRKEWRKDHPKGWWTNYRHDMEATRTAPMTQDDVDRIAAASDEYEAERDAAEAARQHELRLSGCRMVRDAGWIGVSPEGAAACRSLLA